MSIACLWKGQQGNGRLAGECAESFTRPFKISYFLGGGEQMTPPNSKPKTIAYRKACKPNGIGLSHYVLIVNSVSESEGERNAK